MNIEEDICISKDWHMGIHATLCEIPAIIFEEIKTGGGIDQQTLINTPSIFLDKSWYEIHSLFRDIKPPLNQILSGDWVHPSSPTNIEAFNEGKIADYYFAISSPPLVLKIATAISMLSKSELSKIANEKNIIFDEYLQRYFGELAEAYTQAAKNGNALSIIIA